MPRLLDLSCHSPLVLPIARRAKFSQCPHLFRYFLSACRKFRLLGRQPGAAPSRKRTVFEEYMFNFFGRFQSPDIHPQASILDFILLHECNSSQVRGYGELVCSHTHAVYPSSHGEAIALCWAAEALYPYFSGQSERTLVTDSANLSYLQTSSSTRISALYTIPSLCSHEADCEPAY